MSLAMTYKCLVCAQDVDFTKKAAHDAICQYRIPAKLDLVNKNRAELLELLQKYITKDSKPPPPIVDLPKMEKTASAEGIPCDVCGKSVQFALYEAHLSEHSKKKSEENEMAALGAVIPCDTCGASVPFLDYNAHLLTHGPVSVSPPVPPPMPTIAPLPVLVPSPVISTGSAIIPQPKILPSEESKSALVPEVKMEEKKEAKATVKMVQCEACTLQIPESDYERHIDEHFIQIYKDQPLQVTLPKSEEELTRSKYKKTSTQRECIICYEEFKEGDSLIYLPCTHFFHEKCILDWLKKQNLCPSDNKPVFLITS